MITPATSNRTLARTAMLDGLARLRAAFPLEARLHAAGEMLRQEYGRVLAHWLNATIPPHSLLDRDALAGLQQLDAVVPDTAGLGCYPFSARVTGIVAELPAGRVPAMCAIDALAIARLARTRTTIAAHCVACGAALGCRVEDNGALDHDQAERARVVWQASGHEAGSCSASLCRTIGFLCNDCAPPANSLLYTLPQAAAIGNAFFAFQQVLLSAAGAAPLARTTA